MGSLLAALNKVWGVLVEGQFIVQCDPEVSETVHNLHWLIVSVCGFMRSVFSKVVENEFFGFGDTEKEMIVLAPLGKMRNRSFVCCDWVLVREKSQYGSVIRVFKVFGCGGMGWDSHLFKVCIRMDSERSLVVHLYLCIYRSESCRWSRWEEVGCGDWEVCWLPDVAEWC